MKFSGRFLNADDDSSLSSTGSGTSISSGASWYFEGEREDVFDYSDEESEVIGVDFIDTVSETKMEGMETAEMKMEGMETAETKMEGMEMAETKTEGMETAETKMEGMETAETKMEGMETAETKTEGMETAETTTERAKMAETKIEGMEIAETKTEGVKMAETEAECGGLVVEARAVRRRRHIAIRRSPRFLVKTTRSGRFY